MTEYWDSDKDHDIREMLAERLRENHGYPDWAKALEQWKQLPGTGTLLRKRGAYLEEQKKLDKLGIVERALYLLKQDVGARDQKAFTKIEQYLRISALANKTGESPDSDSEEAMAMSRVLDKWLSERRDKNLEE